MSLPIKCRRVGAQYALLAVLCLTASACTAGRSPTPEPAFRPSGVTLADLAELAWLPDGRLVFRGGGRLVTWHEGDAAAPVDFTPPNMTGCQLTSYSGPTVVSSDTVSLVRTCSKAAGLNFSNTMVTWDGTSLTEVAPLGSYVYSDQLPPRPPDIGRVTWSPDANQAVLDYTLDDCAGIASLAETGLGRFPVLVRANGHVWRIDTGSVDGDQTCDKGGRAAAPAWSPDGRQIAFVGSPARPGSDALHTLIEPWNVYLVAPDGGQARILASGYRLPLSLCWSPDGRRLAFSSYEGGTAGIWVLDVSSGRAHRVSKLVSNFIAWSPDSHRLAVIGRVTRPGPSRLGTIAV